jgi:hypothetical protein
VLTKNKRLVRYSGQVPVPVDKTKVRKRNPTKRNVEICKSKKTNYNEKKRNEIYKVRKQYQMKKKTNSVK